MMSHCKRCGSEIAEDLRMNGIAACGCGWTDNSRQIENMERLATRKITNFGIGATVLILPVVIYLSMWSGFGLEMASITLQELTGTASITTLHRKAEICQSLRKSVCAAEIYARLIRTQPQSEEAYLRLAHMHLQAEDTASAIQVYQAYFKNGGKDANLRFRVANLLANSGRVDEAIQAYQELMTSEPGILQITVAKSYVQLLIKLDRFEAAKTVIQQFQGQDDNAKDYLNEELTLIENGLKKSKSAS